MTEASVITQEMRDAIGVESSPRIMEVDKTTIRMFARAVGYTDPVFFDETEAKACGYRSLPVPPGYLGTPVFNPAHAGQEPGGPSLVRTSLRRVLNGGTEIEFYGDICAGDVLTARSRITDISERTGGIGKMLITVMETRYTNQDGELVAASRGTIINY